MIASLVLAAAVYSGRDNQLHVTIPRVDTPSATITVDGILDEPAWQQAVRLTDFSQYSPVDGRAADSGRLRARRIGVRTGRWAIA